MPQKCVVISGHCQPPHRGHVEYCRHARDLAGPEGWVIFIVNNDAQGVLKKGFSFMPQEDRLAIMGGMRDVNLAILSIDRDRTVCKTIEMLCQDGGGKNAPKPTHFANGGDVSPDNRCPEEAICQKYGIELVYGLGVKVQSSTDILQRLQKK